MINTLNHSRFLKRLIDFTAAFVALILLWPIMLVVAALIAWKMGWPVVFTQTRPGLHGKPIQFYKFRTMRTAFDASGQPLPDSERLTPLGKFIRKTSMDELPQLINVLKGEVSLVGPRPLLMEYLPFYTAEENLRHSVLPGITGWAQINGRNAIGWDERLKLDVEYVKNWSLAFDVKIIFLTFFRVIKPQGISAAGQATMHRLDHERSGKLQLERTPT